MSLFFDKQKNSFHAGWSVVDTFDGSMRVFILGIAYFMTLSATGQFLDLARLEHTYVPGSDANFEYRRTQVVINYPIKLKNEAGKVNS